MTVSSSPSLPVSVVITTQNRSRMLLDTLRSVLSQTYPSGDFEIIIMDNGSTDDTREVVEAFISSYSGPHVIRYVCEDRLGLHYARARAAYEMHGEIYAQIEDDAVADPNWLQELVAPFSDPQIGATGGKVLPRWQAEAPEWILKYPIFLTIFDLGDQVLETGVTACSLAVKRRLLFQVGGFNPDCIGSVWMGDGEGGLQRKIKRAGYKVLYVPTSIVWHIQGQGRLTHEYMRRRLANEASCSLMSWYQQERPGAARLWIKGGRSIAATAAHRVIALLLAPRKSQAYYDHDLKASLHSRFVRLWWRMLQEREFRQFMGREDWISHSEETLRI